MTARIAPSWMTISNVPAAAESKPSSSPARTRWPVEETGMNSVSPSTMPSKMIVRREASILIRQSRQRRCGSRSVGRLDREAAVAAVGGEPAFGDGGQRRRRDAHLFEPPAAPPDDLLQPPPHPPAPT